MLQVDQKSKEYFSTKTHDYAISTSYAMKYPKLSFFLNYGTLCGEFTGTSEFPVQMASNAENASIWLRHHVIHRDWDKLDEILLTAF